MSPRASIVVPAFQAEATLSETLASLCAQTERDIEIVVVDDGSTDGTNLIATSAAHADPRVHVVRQANRGLAGARNTGIHAARADVVGFCDADDLWEPHKIALHLARFDADPSLGISYAGSALIDMAGARTGHLQRPRLGWVDAAHVMKRNPVGNGSAAVMRRAALEAISWTPSHERDRPWVFDETLRRSEDIECWLRLAISTDWGIEGIPGALTLYRVSPGGLSADTGAQLESWERAMSRLAPRAPALFARHMPAARAYQLRYLARRAVSARDGARARALLAASGAASRAPWFEEPMKTAVTHAAAAALRLVPGALDAAERLRAARAVHAV